MIYYLDNNAGFHYEIIETFLFLLKSHCIYLNIVYDKSFLKYITDKYDVILGTPTKFDVYISLTTYDKDYDKINPNHYYVCHEITPRLKKLKNTIFLTPLCKNYITCDKLPFFEMKKKSNIAIYIIQGNIDPERRNYKLLDIILSKKYKYPFIIKMVGKGKPTNHDVVFRLNLDFINYHKEFLDAYCILPLITKKHNPQYYKNKLTSSINYCIGYKLKCLIDKDLQKIYNLKDVEVFKDENDIQEAFERTLHDFYE